MELLGFLLAVLIGVSLGLVGSGGSILTVPVLVYIINIQPVEATAYSLFIVGITSLVGARVYHTKGLIHYKAAVIFSIPALTGVFLTRLFLLPAIPLELFYIGNYLLTKQMFIMVLFALLMLLAAISMIRRNGEQHEECPENFNYLHISLEGITIGILTGLVGAGGGFLIIPALVILAKIPMKMAVGTSLIIIAAKSLIGFLGDVNSFANMSWSILIGFSILAIVGIFIGSYLSRKISNKKLKPAFGWFVLVMSIYIMIKEIFNNNMI